MLFQKKKKKNLDIVRNFAKTSQHTILWLFAYGAVLYEEHLAALRLVPCYARAGHKYEIFLSHPHNLHIPFPGL